MSTRTNFTTTHPSNIDPDGLLATPGKSVLHTVILALQNTAAQTMQ